MLEVMFKLTMVATMLFGVVEPGHLIEVDGLNSPTIGPIPDSPHELETNPTSFKGAR